MSLSEGTEKKKKKEKKEDRKDFILRDNKGKADGRKIDGKKRRRNKMWKIEGCRIVSYFQCTNAIHI